jgi:hypothetical protein
MVLDFCFKHLHMQIREARLQPDFSHAEMMTYNDMKLIYIHEIKLQ